MTLTTSQMATLKADILADASLASIPPGADGAVAIAGIYNQIVVPAHTVWRTSVSRDELQQLDAFDWAQVDNLSVGKARIWDWMFMRGAEINASKANVRAGIAACFTGSVPLTAIQTAVLTACKRSASRVEKLFALWTGSLATPAVMAVEGPISGVDVQTAMGW